MRRIFLFLLVFYTSGSAFAGGADSAVFRRLIVTYFDGVATKDFVLWEFGKKWKNDSGFKNIQYHEPFGVKYTMTEFEAVAGERTGSATYRVRADFAFGDTEKVQLHFVEAAVFRKEEAGWKIRMIQVSLVESPAVQMPDEYRKYDTVRYIRSHYTERLAGFAGEKVSPGRIVFFGNSITEFGDWKRLLGDSTVVNRGIAGDNTFGMLDRLSSVIALKPRELFIEAGINDIGQGVPASQIAANIGTMVAYVRAKLSSARVYVVSVLPTNGHAQTDYPEIAGKNAVALAVDRLLREQAASRGYIYLDLAGRVADGSGGLDERYAQPDGLLLNDAGYGVWMEMIRGR